jgi:hypothetical protein
MMGARVVTCHEITRGGEGARGQSMTASLSLDSRPRFLCAADCAEYAAWMFDERELGAGGLTDSDLDGGSRVIEVDGFGGDAGPRRFRVWTRVTRSYESRPEPGPGAKTP